MEELPQPPPVHIPDELIKEILLSLPVKSLVRFMCVCKSWKLIISDPQFVNLHRRRSSSNTAHFPYTRLLFDLFNINEDVSPRSDTLLFSSRNQNGYDLYPIEENGYGLIGVCNGLVSLMKLEVIQPSTVWVQFWNPATRLRSQDSPPVNMFVRITCGFGYDCLNDTYKVVVVGRIENKGEHVVNIYHKGGSCWRTIQSFPGPPPISWSSQEGVYVTGTLNWVVIINTNMFMFIIVSLDLGSEEFSQLTLPNSAQFADIYPGDLDYKPSFPPTLGVLKDSLCVLHTDNNEGRFIIWQMKEFGAHES